MSTPKPKGPTPIVLKNDGPFRRRVDVPATSTGPDPYQPNAKGTSTRQGQPVDTRKTRAQFRQVEFQRAIFQHGAYLIWAKAMVCPCLNRTTNQPQINCLLCDGTGLYYTDPIEIRGLLFDKKRNPRAYDRESPWVQGEASLTVEPQYRMSYRDRIEMRDAVMVHSELFIKGDRRALRSKLPAGMDSLRYRVVRVVRMVWKDTASSVLVLKEDVHFKVSEDGWIEWLDEGNKAVADDELVSVTYEYHPIYLVMDQPKASREATLETKVPVQQVFALPVQVTVQLDNLTDVDIPLPSMCEVTWSRRIGET